MKKKIVIAITGASGMIYAKSILKMLNSDELKSQLSNIALIFSDNVKGIWNNEIKDVNLPDFVNHLSKSNNLNFKAYKNNNFYVPFASGSSAYDIMIIIPCSMGTLGRISNGISDNLINRTADVMLKERKKIIFVTREMPLSLIHINNMKTITEAGGIICPASPTFYNKPSNILDLSKTVVERALDIAGFNFQGNRWKQ